MFLLQKPLQAPFSLRRKKILLENARYRTREVLGLEKILDALCTWISPNASKMHVTPTYIRDGARAPTSEEMSTHRR